jgi:hypothetical protein
MVVGTVIYQTKIADKGLAEYAAALRAVLAHYG